MKFLVMAMVVVAAGLSVGRPLQPQPRKFVYQVDSPFVRLYPVYFERHQLTAQERGQKMVEGGGGGAAPHAASTQSFNINMLLSEAKTPGKMFNSPNPIPAVMNDVMKTTQPSTTMTPETMMQPLTPMTENMEHEKEVMSVSSPHTDIVETERETVPIPHTEIMETERETVPIPHTEIMETERETVPISHTEIMSVPLTEMPVIDMEEKESMEPATESNLVVPAEPHSPATSADTVTPPHEKMDNIDSVTEKKTMSETVAEGAEVEDEEGARVMTVSPLDQTTEADAGMKVADTSTQPPSDHQGVTEAEEETPTELPISTEPNSVF